MKVLFVLLWVMVSVAPVQGTSVRVAISDSEFAQLFHSEVEITGGSVVLHDGAGEILASDRFVIVLAEGSLSVTDGDKMREVLPPLRLHNEDEEPLVLTSVLRGGTDPFTPHYRGVLEIHLLEEGLKLVNEVPLEEYLYGVVPSEMPAGWPLEALKVQAVASRTYVVRQMLAAEVEGRLFHIDDSMWYQVYNDRHEAETARQAVDKTRGLVIKDADDGALLPIYFHSTSSGRTASACDVWQGIELPHLVSRSVTRKPWDEDLTQEAVLEEFILEPEQFVSQNSFYEAESPWFRWEVRFSREQLDAIIHNSLDELYGLQPEFILTHAGGEFVSKPIDFDQLGQFVDAVVTERSPGGYATALELTMSGGRLLVIKELNIRRLLRPVDFSEGAAPIPLYRQSDVVNGHPLLPSSAFVLEVERDGADVEAVVVRGAGSGHGVGISQWGARGMALAGLDYVTIIESFLENMVLGPYERVQPAY